ncbi:DEAD/DEAH box helicase family protein [Streptomyces sp. CRN 30]|uniref:DEAD/DEAH box helicase family protein n=1 Tax=Streptomyces sp. CRN 30 TaxID=3075613 RepID=UPI002A82C7FA|nr:DEAD/DEAH box helicase family protein [Streptomyces sp. CRN 30]
MSAGGATQTLDPRLAELARTSGNFGFLYDHVPMLVAYGSSAEANVFTDPNTSLIKSRQFGEALASDLVPRGRVQFTGSKQVARLAALDREGYLHGDVGPAFHEVRVLGNKANHEGYNDPDDAFRALRTCHRLGVWYHRLISGSREQRTFVPPGPARTPAAQNTALRAQVKETRRALKEARLTYEGQASQAQAEQTARITAERELAEAAAEREDLARQVAAMHDQLAALQQAQSAADARLLREQVTSPATASEAVAERARLLENAEQAAREPLTEAQVRTLARWIRQADQDPQALSYRARLRLRMPELDERPLRPAHITAVREVEKSVARSKGQQGTGQSPSLVQMATGAGKTYTVVTFSYRMLRFAQAERILFLVDRDNLGAQAQNEFENVTTPDTNRTVAGLFNVQRLGAGGMNPSAKVVVCTVQRLYMELTGATVPATRGEDEYSYDAPGDISVGYNAGIPPESFDLIVVDEYHRSIYGKWRSVPGYFDAPVVGLTAPPVAQTFGYFNGNLVSECTYPAAVTDGVNVRLVWCRNWVTSAPPRRSSPRWRTASTRPLPTSARSRSRCRDSDCGMEAGWRT